MNSKRLTSFAQNREDIIISGFFKDIKNGFYIDVGANDPVTHSVTKYFYDMGWSGINIEPIPKYHKKLEQQRQRDINLAIGISNRVGIETLTYYPEGDGLSTLSNQMVSEHDKKPTKFNREKQQLTIKVKPLKNVLEEHAKNKTINFIKIDVEGHEAEVIKSNDWVKFRPQLICIEANHVYNDWEKILIKNNYKRVFFDGINNYYIANEAGYLAEDFSYEQTMLPKPILSNDIQGLIVRQKEEIKNLEHQIITLNSVIEQSKRFRYATANLLFSIDRTIMLQLNKLNRKAPEETSSKANLVIPTDTKKDDRLKKLRIHDISSLYVVEPKPSLLYRSLVFIYKTPARLVYKAYKKMIG